MLYSVHKIPSILFSSPFQQPRGAFSAFLLVMRTKLHIGNSNRVKKKYVNVWFLKTRRKVFCCNSSLSYLCIKKLCYVRTIKRLILTVCANRFYCTITWRARAQLESISFLFLLTKEREKGRREAGRKEEEQLTRRKQAYQTGVYKANRRKHKKSFYSRFIFQGRNVIKKKLRQIIHACVFRYDTTAFIKNSRSKGTFNNHKGDLSPRPAGNPASQKEKKEEEGKVEV